MRLFVILILVYFVLSNIISYYKNQMDNPPPNTLSYYIKKSEKEPLTEKGLQEVEKISSKLDKFAGMVNSPKKTLQQRVNEERRFYFYVLALFSALYFFIQYLTWENMRDHLLSMICLGVLSIICGLFLSQLSQLKIADVLLLKPSLVYFDSSLNRYAQRPITLIVCGYILIFNSFVCWVIDRVLVAKEINSIFSTKD